MDFYNEILNLSDEELKTKVRDKIKSLEALENEENVLGYHLECNPTKNIIVNADENKNFDVVVRCFYNGYIKKGSKMVYGTIFSLENSYAYNDGRYYYVDDDSYIYDFCRYIRDYDIYDEYELFGFILDFLRDYYGYIGDVDRENMFKLIMEEDKRYFEPIVEHKLSDFKGKANALCSEYSIMAQNILSVFGMECFLIIGKVKTGNNQDESHAYNIINFTESRTDKDVSAIIDFSNYVRVFDMNYEVIGVSPFIAEIPEFNVDLLNKLLYEEAHLLYDDYAYLIFGNELLKISYDVKRNYYIDNNLTPDEIYVRKTL